MKKYAAFLMFLALLLTCACSQKPAEKPAPDVPPVQEQPQTPEPIAPAPQPERPAAPQTPETPPAPVMPEVPVTPVQPEEPQAPQTPVQPEVVEPEGAAIRVKLPAEIEGSSGADCIVPLEGGIVALRSFDGSGRTELVIYDLENNAVLSRESIPGHDGTNELILMDTDPYALRYYDGRDYWEITLDEAWQQSREEFDLALYLSVMGGLMVHQKSDGSISVGRVVSPGLKANDRMGYHLVRILNDHQLLYQAVDKTVSSLSHYGVYDSETDETRAVTTM